MSHWRTHAQIFVAGIPKGQPRARARRGQLGVYDPGTADGWKELMGVALRDSMPEHPLDGAVKVDVDFLMPRPKTFNKRTRAIYGLTNSKMPKGEVWHTGKPDPDNLHKAVLDTMTQMGYLRDDAIVCHGEISKRYHADGDRSGALIMIRTLVMEDAWSMR